MVDFFGFLHAYGAQKYTHTHTHTQRKERKKERGEEEEEEEEEEPDFMACTYRLESLLKKCYRVMQLICCGAKL